MIRRKRAKRKLNAEINVVPYIDVTMVLLIIFMVTAPLMKKSVDVELPKTSANPVDMQQQEPLIVTVDKEGRYYVNVGNDDKDSEPLEPTQVADRVKKVLAAKPQTLLLVRGDKSVNYDAVIQLMALLKGAGASSVGLVTE